MKIRNLSAVLFTVAFMTLMLGSCQKFAEGGQVSKAETNLKTSWKLEKYLRNSNDETANLSIQNYEETYSNDAAFTRSYVKNAEVILENGNWHLDKDQEKLQVSGIGSVEITTASGTVSSSYYTIIKLDRNEFWYYFINGSDKHEFHLVKK